MTAKPIHPLLIRGKQITQSITAWKLKKHPHAVAGRCRGLEVRVYHYPAEGWDPYFITMVAKEGMGDAAKFFIDGRCSRSCSR
jgi:hypothetical protein